MNLVSTRDHNPTPPSWNTPTAAVQGLTPSIMGSTADARELPLGALQVLTHLLAAQ
jgi:hypothetical protein